MEKSRKPRRRRKTRSKRDPRRPTAPYRSGAPLEIIRWDHLSERGQLSLAMEIARRLGPRLRREFSGIVSVGAGYKTSRSVGGLTRRVSVRILVENKKAADELHPNQVLPSAILTTRRVGGKKVRYAVPTDVDVAPRHEAGAQNMVGGVLAVPPGGQAGVSGAMCALVRHRDDPARMFVLGCHHVLTRSLESDACGPREPTDLLRGDAGHRRIGKLATFTVLVPPSGAPGMDAALALVEDQDTVSSFIHELQPTRVARAAELPTDFRIYAPRAQLDAEFVSIQFDCVLTYQCGAQVRVDRVYESIASTRPGDSGAPLLGIDGVLYGMHFYGTTEGRSLSIPAADLFEDGVFSIPIRLKLDHDP